MTEGRKVYRDRDGVRRTMIWDDEKPSQVTVHTEQDLEEILAGIARDRELHSARGDMKLAARIPVAVYERMVLEGWDEDDFRRWLNSPAAAPFRIWRGSV